jgi:hypothetical protein
VVGGADRDVGARNLDAVRGVPRRSGERVDQLEIPSRRGGQGVIEQKA